MPFYDDQLSTNAVVKQAATEEYISHVFMSRESYAASNVSCLSAYVFSSLSNMFPMTYIIIFEIR